METIKNYLESMFMKLPATEEVLKAKRELLQMMTDKYEELIAEGKRENEAVSIVISEFGDLNEIAEDLGIKGAMSRSTETGKKEISKDDAFSYIKYRAQAAFRIGAGIACFIASPVGFVISEEAVGFSLYKNEAFGLIFFFAMVAIGVALLVFTGVDHGKWHEYFDGRHMVSMMTVEEITKARRNNLSVKNLYLTVGIAIIICGLGITAVIDEIMHSDVAGAAFLLATALGVCFVVYAGVSSAAYNRILTLSSDGNAVKSVNSKVFEVEENDNKWRSFIKECFWPTVVCAYLIISFLTGAWYISWIIWPIAPILYNLLMTLTDKN